MRTKEIILMTLIVISIIPKLPTIASEEEETSFFFSSEDIVISWSSSDSRLIPLNFSLPSGNYQVTIFWTASGNQTDSPGYELIVKGNSSSALFIFPREQQDGLERKMTSQIILTEENTLYLDISWEKSIPLRTGELLISSESYLKELQTPSEMQISPAEIIIEGDSGQGQMIILIPIEAESKGLVHTLSFEIEIDTSLSSLLNWIKLDFSHINQLQYSIEFNSGGSHKLSFNFVSELLVPLLVIDYTTEMEGQVKVNLIDLKIDNKKIDGSGSSSLLYNLSEDPALTLLLLYFLVFGTIFGLKTVLSLKLTSLKPKTVPSSKFHNPNYIITQNSEPLTFSLNNFTEVNKDE